MNKIDITFPEINIRNFCIVAHIDHGKTTLSGALLKYTNMINIENKLSSKNDNFLLLDSMDLEKERGISIKSHPVSIKFRYQKRDYLLNLIDTPGHVDFSYEVSRSLSACEAVFILVDASQGIEAQTIANFQLALSSGIKIIPLINKIDLPNVNLQKIKDKINELFNVSNNDIICVSAKKMIGIDCLFQTIIEQIPYPTIQHKGTSVLIFDSIYDSYKGIIFYVRVFSGNIKVEDEILIIQSNTKAKVKEVGYFTPKMQKLSVLHSGYVGYIIPNLKSSLDIKIGYTITKMDDKTDKVLPGYQKIEPIVFSSIYPKNSSDYNKLKASIEKLNLNDSSFTYQVDQSSTIGMGLRCGFLGLLHMDIIKERIIREYKIDIIITSTGVLYNIITKENKTFTIENPHKFPPLNTIKKIEEPIAIGHINCPEVDIGSVLQLIFDKRGKCLSINNTMNKMVIIHVKLPLNEIIIDFNDKLKSITKGYGSIHYKINNYEETNVSKIDIMINDVIIEAFSFIMHKSKVVNKSKEICKKIKDILPRHLFKVNIKAFDGKRVIAKENISAMRKDVTAKCYGGDITRKRKLLEKQKQGKNKMNKLGKVYFSQKDFFSIIKYQ